MKRILVIVVTGIILGLWANGADLMDYVIGKPGGMIVIDGSGDDWGWNTAGRQPQCFGIDSADCVVAGDAEKGMVQRL